MAAGGESIVFGRTARRATWALCSDMLSGFGRANRSPMPGRMWVTYSKDRIPQPPVKALGFAPMTKKTDTPRRRSRRPIVCPETGKVILRPPNTPKLPTERQARAASDAGWRRSWPRSRSACRGVRVLSGGAPYRRPEDVGITAIAAERRSVRGRQARRGVARPP